MKEALRLVVSIRVNLRLFEKQTAAFLGVGLALLLASADAKTVIPDFAQICGVRVGGVTFPALETKLGAGKAVVGGHPRGGRLWSSRVGACTVYADGLYYRENGARVVDQIFLRTHANDPELPQARLSRREVRFLGVVALGATKSETLHLLASRLPPPKVDGDEFSWKARGFAHTHNGNFKTWKAILTFKDGELGLIRIDCDVGARLKFHRLDQRVLSPSTGGGAMTHRNPM